MKANTLQSVPDRKLRKWLAAAEKQFGTNSITAKTLRAELRRRKGCGHAK